MGGDKLKENGVANGRPGAAAAWARLNLA